MSSKAWINKASTIKKKYNNYTEHLKTRTNKNNVKDVKAKKNRTYEGQSVWNIHVTILIQSTGVSNTHECFQILHYR